MLPGGAEEAPELRRGPDLARVRTLHAGSLRSLDGVGRQELVDRDGIAERLAQNGMHVRDRTRGQALATLAAVTGLVSAVASALPYVKEFRLSRTERSRRKAMLCGVLWVPPCWQATDWNVGTADTVAEA